MLPRAAKKRPAEDSGSDADTSSPSPPKKGHGCPKNPFTRPPKIPSGKGRGRTLLSPEEKAKREAERRAKRKAKRRAEREAERKAKREAEREAEEREREEREAECQARLEAQLEAEFEEQPLSIYCKKLSRPRRNKKWRLSYMKTCSEYRKKKIKEAAAAAAAEAAAEARDSDTRKTMAKAAATESRDSDTRKTMATAAATESRDSDTRKTMATAAATEAGDSECGICHELFLDPKVLWCGHVLCAPCILSRLTSQQDASCPLCHCPILSPDSGQGQSLLSFVYGLPTDVTMKIWVESQQLLSQDHTCQSCVTQAATSLCLHCRDFLCSSCAAMHGRLSSTRHHQVETLSSLTPQKLAISYCAPCQAHPTELSRLYCSTHQVSICMLCTLSKHRNCAGVKDMEERAAEIQAELTDVVVTLTEEESQLDQALQELERLDQDIEKAEQADEAEIGATFDGLEATLRKRRLQAIEESRSKFAQSRTAVQDKRAGLLKKRGQVTTHKVLAEQSKFMAASGEMGEMAVALKIRAEEIHSSPTVPADTPVVTTATFLFNSEALSLVEKALAEIGQIKVTPAAVVTPQALQFCFHNNCGENIVFSNNQLTAERKGSDDEEGIVVSSQPMMPHKLYEVHLDEREAFSGWYMRVGAVTTAPSSTTLPRSAYDWPSAIVFHSSSVQVLGTEFKTGLGEKLRDMPKGSRVGVMIDNSGSIHLYINGEDQGYAGTLLTQSCFAFFDVFGSYRKVTALPVTVVP